jgi:hypothetical protein
VLSSQPPWLPASSPRRVPIPSAPVSPATVRPSDSRAPCSRRVHWSRPSESDPSVVK